ncbi:hypothetical protein Tco_1470416, partial [Tanacetum coccineum]
MEVRVVLLKEVLSGELDQLQVLFGSVLHLAAVSEKTMISVRMSNS